MYGSYPSNGDLLNKLEITNSGSCKKIFNVIIIHIFSPTLLFDNGSEAQSIETVQNNVPCI